MEQERLMIKRQTRRRPMFWIKTVLSLGIWLLWWHNDYLALTRRSVIRHKGLFNREERAVPLNQVQDIGISYGIIRRLLGHGDVRIETAGSSGTEILMKNVDKPEEFRDRVFEQINAFYDEEELPKDKRAG